MKCEKKKKNKANQSPEKSTTEDETNAESRNKSLKLLDRLFEEKTADEIITLSQKHDVMGLGPLSMVAAMGHVTGVRKLLEAGVVADDPSLRDGETPLTLSARSKHVGVVELLLQYCADVTHVNNEGDNAFMISIKVGDPKVVNMIWGYRGPLDINHKNKNSITALHYAAERGWESCVQFLVLQGADVNAQDKNGSTPLIVASVRGDQRTVEVLIKAGCNLLIEDNTGCTAVCRALQAEKFILTEFMLKKFSDQLADSYIKTRAERMRKPEVPSHEIAYYYKHVLFPMLRVLGKHGRFRDLLFRHKVIAHAIVSAAPFVSNPLIMTAVCQMFSVLLYHCPTYVEERFVLQFIKSGGPEFVVKALKIFSDSKTANVSPQEEGVCFMPLLSTSEVGIGREWLQKNSLKVTPYSRTFEVSLDIMDFADDESRQKTKSLWSRFREYFDKMLRKQCEHQEALLLEEEEREKNKREKKREKKRQRRHRQSQSRQDQPIPESDIQSGDFHSTDDSSENLENTNILTGSFLRDSEGEEETKEEIQVHTEPMETLVQKMKNMFANPVGNDEGITAVKKPQPKTAPSRHISKEVNTNHSCIDELVDNKNIEGKDTKKNAKNNPEKVARQGLPGKNDLQDDGKYATEGFYDPTALLPGIFPGESSWITVGAKKPPQRQDRFAQECTTVLSKKQKKQKKNPTSCNAATLSAANQSAHHASVWKCSGQQENWEYGMTDPEKVPNYDDEFPSLTPTLKQKSKERRVVSHRTRVGTEYNDPIYYGTEYNTTSHCQQANVDALAGPCEPDESMFDDHFSDEGKSSEQESFETASDDSIPAWTLEAQAEEQQITFLGEDLNAKNGENVEPEEVFHDLSETTTVPQITTIPAQEEGLPNPNQPSILNHPVEQPQADRDCHGFADPDSNCPPGFGAFLTNCRMPTCKPMFHTTNASYLHQEQNNSSKVPPQAGSSSRPSYGLRNTDGVIQDDVRFNHPNENSYHLWGVRPGVPTLGPRPNVAGIYSQMTNPGQPWPRAPRPNMPEANPPIHQMPKTELPSPGHGQNPSLQGYLYPTEEAIRNATALCAQQIANLAGLHYQKSMLENHTDKGPTQRQPETPIIDPFQEFVNTNFGDNIHSFVKSTFPQNYDNPLEADELSADASPLQFHMEDTDEDNTEAKIAEPDPSRTFPSFHSSIPEEWPFSKPPPNLDPIEALRLEQVRQYRNQLANPDDVMTNDYQYYYSSLSERAKLILDSECQNIGSIMNMLNSVVMGRRGANGVGINSHQGTNPNGDGAKAESQVENNFYNGVRWTSKSSRWRKKFHEMLSDPQQNTRLIGCIRIPTEQEVYSLRKGNSKTTLGLLVDGSEVAVTQFRLDQLPEMFSNLNILLSEEADHLFLAKYLAIEQKNQFCYMAKELCEYTLEEYIRVLHLNRRLDPLCADRLVWQLLRGLKHLHDNCKILHHNLRPTNILVDKTGKVKLGDFGQKHSALERNASQPLPDLDRRCWQPCEVLVSNTDSCYSAKSDVQVAGMLIYYILSGGNHPYGKSPFEIETNICRNWHQLMPISEEANDMVLSMLSYTPLSRPSVAEALRHPYFWSEEKRFRFLLIVGSDILKELKGGSVGTTVTDHVNIIYGPAVSADWISQIDDQLVKEMHMFRQYRNSIPELVLFLYNCCLHFDKLSMEAREILDDPCKYFNTKFPTLFMAVYRMLRTSETVTTRKCYMSFF